ncbi:tetraacyldisaccharide 4'-kinase [Bernardetia sp.]|uniref:tetraacyldisaccharide 4'-kinase n=1 Tax=Bernardetia sp. TaxID=1937974 RepID=UPI0025C6E8A5|nr:tetraacyldisaccharide 4'-kinase [Bernardetia sp.]
MKYLLFPFAILYDAITRLRNYFYDKEWFKVFHSSVMVVSVGNITVGGTGKTPHTEYLIRYFLQKYKDEKDYQLATLSRGYGRKTKGFVLANETTTASEIGDEPMQFYQKFAKDNSKVNVVVCEKRALGVQKILELFPNTKTILLDDAFQHRAIRPYFSILLSDYNRPFYEDFLLPMGRIRESRRGAKRAHAVFISKSPLNLAEGEKRIIRKKIRKYTKAPIFFTGFEYDTPVSVLNENELLDLEDDTTYSYGILTGIANYKPFQEYVEQKFGQLESEKNFPDHHDYSAKDIGFLKNSKTVWLTTEKDAVKLRPLLEKFTESEKSKLSIFYIPIKVVFLDKNEEKEFGMFFPDGFGGVLHSLWG